MSSVGREPPFREDLSTEAEEYQLLEVFTRQLLLKRLWVGKDLACVLVISKVWKLSMVL
jgi:hypothetical protein